MNSLSAIKRVKIVNYMSHKETEIDDLGNLVAIIGDNHSGKTVFMQAIVLTVYGLSWPEEDIRDGESSASIEVEFYNGNKVERRRTRKAQKTIVTFAGESPKEFNGVRDIEDVLYKATGFKRISTSKGSKPVAFQYEALEETEPFLVGSTGAPGLLKAVASFSHGSELPAIKKALTDKKKGIDNNLALNQAKLNDIEEELERFNDPEWAKLNELVEAVEEIDKKINTLCSWDLKLDNVLELRENYLAKRDAARPYDMDEADSLVEEIKAIHDSIEELEELDSLIDQYVEDRSTLREAKAAEEKAGEKLKLDRCSTCNRMCMNG